MTEHDKGFSEARWQEYRGECAAASSVHVQMIPGMEYSDKTNTFHVLVWGPVPFLGEGLDTLEMLKAVRAAQGVAVLAHPTRRNAWRQFNPEWSPYLLGIEFWNRKTDGLAPSQHAPRLIDSAGVVPFVGIDFHTHRQLYPLRMRLFLEGEGLPTEPRVVQALQNRRLQATAFGKDIDHHSGGAPIRALRLMEWGRKLAAGVYRRTVGRGRKHKGPQRPA